MTAVHSVILLFFLLMNYRITYAQFGEVNVPDKVMEEIYAEIKTPYKYGLVIAPSHDSLAFDSPSVFRKGKYWYMTYIVYNGRGYETFIAKSKDLLHWENLGKIMSFSGSSYWDSNQKAGYVALQDYEWGGSYGLQRYNGSYWMSYLGGHTSGYEAGVLSIGMAYTKKDPAALKEWQRISKPVLTIYDKDAGWWDNITLYKSNVIWDKSNTIGYPFVMYYNAKGISGVNKDHHAERIAMAVSEDMIHWKRFGEGPVLDHHQGITGDPFITRINKIWVMFYFGAWWGPTKGAFNRFACSNDLIHWTDWKGPNLIEPSEPYDNQYAHKSSVVKHNGIVYHFYCATNNANQRGIAVATSKDLGQSPVHFVHNPSIGGR